jgi:hypothetical protein
LLAFLFAVRVQALDDAVKAVIDRCTATKSQPTALAQAGGFATLDRCAALGNGNLMVTIAGGPDNITMCLGKTDFWMDRIAKAEWQSANVLPGYLDISIPAMAGAEFKQVVDMYHAEARTTLTSGGNVVEIRSAAPHEADNFVVNDICNRTPNPVELKIAARAVHHRKPEVAFELAAGKDKDIAWVTRKTPMPDKHEAYGDHEFRMWAAVAVRVFGTAGAVDTDTSDKKQVRAVLSFRVEPGKTVRVVTKVRSTGLPITADPADPLPDTLKALAEMNAADIDKLVDEHRKWWDAYWHKSYVQLDNEPVVEKAWYGALYLLASGSKVGHWPAGCNSWPIDDYVPWGGDYHWNYNNQAPYYGAYSANRVEMTEPYDRTVLGANEYGKKQARKQDAPGTLFFIATAPGHLNEPITVGQKTHALEAALNLINRYYYTYDLEWAKRMYPFFKDVSDYWDWDLQRDKEVMPNGSYRYVLKDSGPMEGAHQDMFNGITGLGFVRRFYRFMLDLVPDLEAAGFKTGVGEKDILRWKDFLAHLSDYPMSFAYGRKVFAWSEQSLNPILTEQSWILYPVFPAEQIGLASEPELLRIARNTLIIKPQYYVEWLNNTPNIFAIAARLAHHPPEVIERFRAYHADLGVNNFKSGGGNFEDAGIVEGINNMLLQGHEGVLRLFPCWHHPAAKFDSLRAHGAFLVSAEKKDGVCQAIRVSSEKGRTCSVLNPWRGCKLRVQKTEAGGQTGREQDVEVRSEAYGQVCSFKTDAGQAYVITPKEGIPAKSEYWNAALYKTVTASSDYVPKNETNNWSAAKLTNGTRINTKVGHRGWSSSLYDDPAHQEWVQVDLGEQVPVKRVALWPLDHGDAWQHTHCTEPFVRSDEIDQTCDGFPLNFRVTVSVDGQKWDEVGKRENCLKSATGGPESDLKPRAYAAAENIDFPARSVRYVRIEVDRIRKTRYFRKYAAQLAEIEVTRAD